MYISEDREKITPNLDRFASLKDNRPRQVKLMNISSIPQRGRWGVYQALSRLVIMNASQDASK